MTKCSFCGKEYDLHRGVTFVLNDGRIFRFCSSKCKKNHELGRDSRKVKWVKKRKKVKKVVEKQN